MKNGTLVVIATAVCLFPSCVTLLSQQDDVDGFTESVEDGMTRRVYYCGTRAGKHFFCLKRGRFPDEFIKIPAGEVTCKGPWPRPFSNRETNWILLSDSTLQRLESEGRGLSAFSRTEQDAL